MKAILFFFAFAALFFTTQSHVPCNNPLFRAIAGQGWEFSYLAETALQTVESKVCPGFVGTNSCCDGVVYDLLAAKWLTLFEEVVAIKIRLDVLALQVTALRLEIAVGKAEVASSNLPAAEQKVIIAFLDAIDAAVSVLVPDILANFKTCYSSVLKFYAGLLCKTCDPNWSTWVWLNGSDPSTDGWKLQFAEATCNAFQEACSPFFAPFYTYYVAFVAAWETLAADITDNTTRASILARIEHYNPPCYNASDCLEFICYRFFRGLDRLEDWAQDSFANATTSGGQANAPRYAVPEKGFSAINYFHRRSTVIARDSSGYQSTTYIGSYNPLSQATSLNTDASSSPSSSTAAVLETFWAELLL